MCVNNLPKVVTCFSFFVFILCCSAFISIGERVLLSCVRFSFFSTQAKRLAWRDFKRLRNDGLFCVEWDVKPQLNRSINQSINQPICYLKVERPGVEPATFSVASPTP